MSDADLSWARRNLVKDSDGKCAFERRPEFKRDARTFFAGPTQLNNWTIRVDFKGDDIHPWVFVQMGKRYDFRKRFEEAQIERDPELAPHVGFRRLSPDNDAVALGFIRDWGPLFLDDMTREAIIWIDLNDFWRRHTRYVSIVRLYETLDDYEKLKETVLDIIEKRKLLDSIEPAALGMIPHTHKNVPFARIVDLWSAQDYQRLDQDGVPTWDHKRLRLHARDLIQAELILQTNEGIRSGWEQLDEDESIGFRPTRIATSLWAAMWEMFGLETWRGYSWRSCRICLKYFYPLQANSKCCSPEHQALWSKRQYAKKRRGQAKAAKLRRKGQIRKSD